MKKMIEASWKGFDHDTEPEGGVERGYNLMYDKFIKRGMLF